MVQFVRNNQSIPQKEADYRIEDLKRASEFYRENFNEEKAIQGIKDTAKYHMKFKTFTVANCWHMNSNESDAMWQLYLKSNVGVAIKTSVKNLVNAMADSNDEVSISKVRYIDYENDIWYHPEEYPCRNYCFYTPLVHKRIEFEHESELRLFSIIKMDKWEDGEFWATQENSIGKFINVDLELLIDEIILHPTSDSHIEDKVIGLLEKYQISKPVRKSKLSKTPIY